MNLRDSVCGLLLLAVISLPACSQPDSQAKSEQKSKLVPVKTVSVEEVVIPRTSTQPATIHPFYEAEIKAKVSGYVKELKADIGDYVEQDAVLAVLEVPELQKQSEILYAKIERHVALEQQATAGVDLAKAEVLSAQARLAQSKSEMSRVEASLAAVEAEFERTQDLVQRQSLERRVLDEVRKKRDSELAAKQSTESAITSAEAEVTVAKAKQAAADADAKVAQTNTKIARSELDELNVMIDYATLKAPFAGIVTKRSLDPGDLVQNKDAGDSGQSLFVISQIDKVRVQMPVPEADAALVNRGDKVTLTLPFFSSETPLTGSVTRMSQSLDRSTRTMLIEVELENSDGKLLPGMFGQATIDLSTKVAAATLPARAVRFDESGNAYVYILSSDDSVSVTDVKTGMDNGNSIEILSGVEAGQRVIDAHRERFTTGQKVTVLKN